MAPSKNQEREARETRDRLKLYNARQAVNAHQIRRRRRDNLIAVAGFLVIVTLASLTQFFYFSAGPGVVDPSPSASPAAEGGVPDPSVAENRVWTGQLILNDIPLGITLDGTLAPQAVASLITDIKNEYLVGKSCHRLAVGAAFNVLQCGSEDGEGGTTADYAFGPIENAPADNNYPVASIAMARQADNQNSNGHQFFIVFGPTTIPSDSAGGYSIVGTVTSGLEALQSEIVAAGVVDDAQDGPPVVPTTITAASIQ